MNNLIAILMLCATVGLAADSTVMDGDWSSAAGGRFYRPVQWSSVAGGMFYATSAAATSAPPSNYNTNTVMLCHFDGTNTQNTFSDSSTFGRAITNVFSANIAIVTNAAVFGSGAGYFKQGVLATPYANELNFGSEPWTIEAWVKPITNVDGEFFLWCGRDSSASFYGPSIGLMANGDLKVALSTVPSTWWSGDYKVLANGVVFDSWNHIALTYDGTTYRAYVNGSNSVAQVATNAIYDAGTEQRYVGTYAGDTGYGEGCVDELRVLKGEAAYTNNFVPPTAPFGDAP